ncbi:hypothetical protein Syun_009400 [Stephania yunnanensis]|uniref:Uncharacterized protein n=1 Tax=Stephania yunnanensis TaxID=152371 RepID=A0AAP0PS92_9MAGN
MAFCRKEWVSSFAKPQDIAIKRKPLIEALKAIGVAKLVLAINYPTRGLERKHKFGGELLCTKEKIERRLITSYDGDSRSGNVDPVTCQHLRNITNLYVARFHLSSYTFKTREVEGDTSGTTVVCTPKGARWTVSIEERLLALVKSGWTNLENKLNFSQKSASLMPPEWIDSASEYPRCQARHQERIIEDTGNELTASTLQRTIATMTPSSKIEVSD